MTEFTLAHAADGSPRALCRSLAEQLWPSRGKTLGFIYATSQLAPHLGDCIDMLCELTGIPQWVGTVGMGVCATGVEHFDKPAMVALACRLEEGAFELIGPITKPGAADGIGSGGNVAGFGVVHADPRNNQAGEIVAAIARRTGAYLVGGFTAAGAAFPQAAGTRAVEGCVSGVLLGGRLSVAVGLTQGCTPVGPAHEVTRADGQVLITLDKQRAFDILCEDVGVAEGADPRPWLANVHAALPVAGSDTADYVVRNLVGIDPRQGLVAIADTPAAGDRVLFVRRDAESARKDLARMLGDLKARLSGTPKAGLYYSCVARGPHLFEGEGFELKAIAEAFGDIPIAGFFGNGEISNNRVYGYTGVLTLFC